MDKLYCADLKKNICLTLIFSIFRRETLNKEVDVQTQQARLKGKPQYHHCFCIQTLQNLKPSKQPNFIIICMPYLIFKEPYFINHRSNFGSNIDPGPHRSGVDIDNVWVFKIFLSKLIINNIIQGLWSSVSLFGFSNIVFNMDFDIAWVFKIFISIMIINNIDQRLWSSVSLFGPGLHLRRT